ncbi:hypothetical protein [Streptomyces sp. NPDC000405]|uniref:hypothetical protein n=1 Tax=Streptomyces sp. NPDC000405 TaxID=3161033 RepID=UPI00398CBF5D
MQAPHVSLSAWWGIAIGATVLFLVIFVPLMPTTGTRIRMALTPVAMAAVGVTSAKVKDLPLEVLLPFYTALVLVFVLGFVGRWSELRTKTLDLSLHGQRPENALSGGAWLQLAASLVVLVSLAIWFAASG